MTPQPETMAWIKCRGEQRWQGGECIYPCGCVRSSIPDHFVRLCDYHEGYDDAIRRNVRGLR